MLCDFCPSLIKIETLTNVSKTVNMKFHIGLNPSGGNCVFAADWWKGILRLIGLFFRNCFENVQKNPTNAVFFKITSGDEKSARSGTYPLCKQAEVVAVLSRRCVALFAPC